MIIQKVLSFILARGIPGAVSLFAIVVYTRLLSPEIYGQYAILLSMSGLLITIFYQWMQFALLRFYHKDNVEEQSLKQSLLGAFFFISVIISPLFVILLQLSFDYVYLTISLVSLMLLLSHSFFDLATQLQVNRGQAGLYGVLLSIKSLAGLLFGVLLYYFGFQLMAPLGGLCLAYSLLSIFLYFKFWHRDFRLQLDTTLVKSMLYYGMPLSGTFIMNYIMSNSDRLMLAWLMDESSAGLYAAPFDLSNYTFIVLLISVHLAIYPLIVKSFEDKNFIQTNYLLSQNLIVLLMISILPAIVFTVMVSDVSQLIFGSQFQQQAIQIIPWIALATFFMGLKAYYFDLVFLLNQKTIYLFTIGIAGAVLNVILNYLLILDYGIIGAAYSTCFSYFFILLLSYLLGRKLLKLPFPIKPMLQLIFIFLVLVVCMTSLNSLIQIHLLIQLSIFAFVYAALMLFFNLANSRELLRIVKI